MTETINERLKNSLHNVEEAKRKLDYEHGTLLSLDGAIIKEYTGKAHTISIDESERTLFEGSVFTHNHPGGRAFTVDDIMSFADCKLHEVRATTPQGTFFSLKESTGEVNRSIGQVMKAEKVGSYVEAAGRLQEQINEQNLDLSSAEYQKRLFDIMSDGVDNWLAENAADFGYIYTKGVL